MKSNKSISWIFFGQIPFFAISKLAKKQFLNWEKGKNCQKCNFTKKFFWFISFHEFFCLDFFKFSGQLCLWGKHCDFPKLPVFADIRVLCNYCSQIQTCFSWIFASQVSPPPVFQSPGYEDGIQVFWHSMTNLKYLRIHIVNIYVMKKVGRMKMPTQILCARQQAKLEYTSY